MSSLRIYKKKLLDDDEDISDSDIDFEKVKDKLLFDSESEEISILLENIDQKNLYKELPENLSFDTTFKNSGKQGVLGLLRLPDGKKCVYKISQYLNYLVDQENIILNSLSELREYCPHFVKGYGKCKVLMNSDFRKNENPFKITGKHNIYNDVLLMEYIDKARKFYRYIKNKEIEEEALYSIIKQTLLALSLAQKSKKLTHYDLHSNNVLIKLCNPNSVFLYCIGDSYYCVPTYGYYPVIIDFGFGYVKDMDNNPLYGALAHTQVGFLSNMFNEVSDPKLFLVTVSDEIKTYRKSKKSKKFRRIVKNMFEPLTIDWKSGWDKMGETSCSDEVYKLIKKEAKLSKLFREYGPYCIDLLQKLIQLPLRKRNSKNIEDVFRMMIEEFNKIEMEIGSGFYNIYIFKNTIDAAYEVKNDYSNRDTMEKAVKTFKHKVLDSISHIAKFCNPKLDWDRLLCSMLMFARQMEGVIYEKITPLVKDKLIEYDDLPLKNSEEFYKAIEVNLPSHFEFNTETDIYVWDMNKKNCKKFKLFEKYIPKINKIFPLERGNFLYKFYSNYVK